MRNEEYWLKRINRVYDENYKREYIRKIYSRAYKNIENDIQKLYDKLDKDGSLTTTELYRYDRYQALLKSIKKESGTIRETLTEHTTESLSKAYRDAFEMSEEMLGADSPWGIQNQKMLESMLKTKWAGSNYSQRIWKNTNKIAKRIESDTAAALTQGTNPRTLAKQIQKDFNVAFYAADRLVRTELARAQNQGQLDSYRKRGIKHVKWSAAHDDRTCGICKEYDGKIFDINKCPIILHPNCRCTPLPVMDMNLDENERKWQQWLKEHNLKEDETGELIDIANDKPAELRRKDDISGKTVDISGKSGIIKEGAKKNITIITDKAVESVPKVKISGYSDEQCAFVQQQHKELLRYAKDNNDSKEVAFVFRKGLTDRTEYIGTDDKIDFGTALSGKGDDLFVMHNHPRNSGFSDFDISEFVASDSINSLSIVKNNGNVEVITKSKEYDKKKIIVERERNRKKYIVSGTDDEYRQYINKLLGKLDKKGVIEWIK